MYVHFYPQHFLLNLIQLQIIFLTIRWLERCVHCLLRISVPLWVSLILVNTFCFWIRLLSHTSCDEIFFIKDLVIEGTEATDPEAIHCLLNSVTFIVSCCKYASHFEECDPLAWVRHHPCVCC